MRAVELSEKLERVFDVIDAEVERINALIADVDARLLVHAVGPAGRERKTRFDRRAGLRARGRRGRRGLSAADLIAQADLIVDAAPRFGERFLMNGESVRQRKPMIECAMYDLEAQLTVFRPGETACLACLYPEEPPHWTREFPVFGAVASTVGCLAAVEAIKLITGIGESLAGTLLCADLATMQFRRLPIARRVDCSVCGTPMP